MFGDITHLHSVTGSQLNTPTLQCPPGSPIPASSPSPPYSAAALAAAAAAMAATSGHFPFNFQTSQSQVSMV